MRKAWHGTTTSRAHSRPRATPGRWSFATNRKSEEGPSTAAAENARKHIQPPMNTDERRYSAFALSAFICVHRRLNAFCGNDMLGLRAGMDLERQTGPL